MDKEFVTHEQARELKALGYNEKCFTTYDSDGGLRNPFDYKRSEYEETNISYIEDSKEFLTNDDLNPNANFVIAPLKSQVFRWFREKHNIHAEIRWSPSYEYDPGEWSDAIYEITFVDV